MAISLQTLNSLLKFHKQKMDKLIGDVKKSQNELEDLQKNIATLEQQMAEENIYIDRLSAIENIPLRQISESYFIAKKKELDTMIIQKNAYEENIAQLQEELKAAYQEFKKYDITKKLQEKTQQAISEKAEAAEIEASNQAKNNTPRPV